MKVCICWDIENNIVTIKQRFYVQKIYASIILYLQISGEILMKNIGILENNVLFK